MILKPVGYILLFVVACYVVQFARGWFSDHDEIRKIGQQCFSDNSPPLEMRPGVNVLEQARLRELLGLNMPIRNYCACVSGRAGQHLSRFRVAYEFVVNNRFDREKFMGKSPMTYEKELCKPLLSGGK